MKNTQKFALLILAPALLFLTGCKKEPTASFTYTYSGTTVNFSNTSEDGKSFEWDFGDGQVSSIESPTHNYSTPGVYNVTLTAYSKKEKKSDEASQSVSVGIWNGPNTTFTKVDGADWTLAVNQDRISNSVWLTRANNRGLFNIKDEADYEDFTSPTNTMWAYGTLDNVNSLSFDTWEITNGSSPPSMVGENMVLYLTTENVYLSIKFTSWSSGGGGGMGGFSYVRSTEP